MELVTHYSRSFRRAYERSISEQKYENHFTQDIFKGHNQNCSEFNSYHSHSLAVNSSLNDLRAKDLSVDKKTASLPPPPPPQSLIKMNGCRIKREDAEEEHQQHHHHSPQMIVKDKRQIIAMRRYFCIFCKMDFSQAEDFLDHLELHPNGSFVLVKRDEIIPPPELSPKEQIQIQPQQHHLNHKNDNNNTINNNNNVSDNENKNRISSQSNERFEAAQEEEEEISNLPMLPEMLKNQIKIEPISEDEEDEEMPLPTAVAVATDDHHISMNGNEEPQHHPHLRQQILSSSAHFNDAAAEMNLNSPSPELVLQSPSSNETAGDPNHQLLVLSNPRIGDGPGEYLCNVCHAKFVYKNNLKSHLKRHLGIYPYVCFCGKRYQFKCKLSKHIEQAHAKIKNFKCPVPTCPKKYFTRNDLAFHISVTHQERQEIPCSICQKVFNSQKSLQIHCRKYHRNQES